MSFTVRRIEGRSVPMALCDTCGKRLTDPQLAVVVFDMNKREDAPRLAHKGKCHDWQEQKIEGEAGFAGWNEYGRWMADLLHNTGLRGESLQRAIQDSDRMGEWEL